MPNVGHQFNEDHKGKWNIEGCYSRAQKDIESILRVHTERGGQGTGREQAAAPEAFALIKGHGWNIFGIPELRLDWSIQTKKKKKKKKRSVLVSSTVVLPKGCMRKGIGRQERFSYCQRCWGIHIRNLTLTCDSKGCYLGCALVNEASVSSRSL